MEKLKDHLKTKMSKCLLLSKNSFHYFLFLVCIVVVVVVVVVNVIVVITRPPIRVFEFNKEYNNSVINFMSTKILNDKKSRMNFCI